MIKYKVLIAEDENLIALNIQNILNDYGFEVAAVVKSGEEIIAVSKEIMPDIIVADVNLKGTINGIDAARKINALYKTPIIFVTGFSDQFTVQQVKDITPCFYLTKPFSKSILIDSICSCLAKTV